MGCEGAVVGIWDEQGVVEHQVAAVLPTGVAETRLLEGRAATDAAAIDSTDSGCAMDPGPRRSGAAWGVGAVLGAIVVRRRRLR